MPVTVLVGLQWGDEGKGKATDELMEEHDICARFSGGPNTGASVEVNDVRYKFRHIPVSVLRRKLAVLGSGMYINPKILLEEIKTLSDQCGFDVGQYLKISALANIITDEHIKEDSLGGGVGSTKNGMGPVATAKYSRKAVFAYQSPELEPYICDISRFMDYHLSKGDHILCEGSQGTMLDIDHGFYPYISCSNNVAAAAAVSCGFGPTHITRVVGVVKPYLTKVGDGPFPSEMDEEDKDIAETIARLGNEYGTVTGRPRRIGWIDFPLLRYAIKINGCTEIFLTKCDILPHLPILKYAEYEFTDRPANLRLKKVLPQNLTIRHPLTLIAEYANPLFVTVEMGTLFKRIEKATRCKILNYGWSPEREE